MGNPFATRERGAGAVERRRRLRGDLFLFHRSGSQRTRQRFHHHCEQTANSGELFRGQHVEQRVGRPAFSFGVSFYRFLPAILDREARASEKSIDGSQQVVLLASGSSSICSRPRRSPRRLGFLLENFLALGCSKLIPADPQHQGGHRNREITPVRFIGGNQDLGDPDLLRQFHLRKPRLFAKASQTPLEGFPAEIQGRFLNRCFPRRRAQRMRIVGTQRAVTFCYTSLESMNMRSCALLEASDGA